MATTLAMEVPQRVTLNATAGLVTLLNVPTGCAYVRVRFITANGFVTRNVADGASKGTAYETYDSGVVYTLSVTPRMSSGLVGVAHTDNSGVVELTALPAGR